MKKPVIRDLDQEKDMARPNLLQILYAVYTFLYYHFCRGTFSSYIPDEISRFIFYGVTVLEIILIVSTLIYNRRYEERTANRYMCYAFVFLAAAGFFLYLF